MPTRLAAPHWLALRRRRPDHALVLVLLTAALALCGAWGWQDAEWSDLLPARRPAPAPLGAQAPAKVASYGATAPAPGTAKR